ncbi:MAG: glycerol-3-phosphate acyltransferase [Anaerosomatales bacterium]|nr:glycerol-3-phosphate acyltransferase [Anaerosomatales bacterium]
MSVLKAAAVFAASLLVGSIPWAYLIVRAVTGDDITLHGSGNVGAMNVRRTTGSWSWFVVAMFADALKGLLPTMLAKVVLASTPLLTPASQAAPSAIVLPQAAVLGAVVGHNYSIWLAIKDRRLRRTGKGLAAGAGALLAYDVRYFAAVLAAGLIVLALTRIMLAGQVAAALALPVSSLLMRSPDWPFAIALSAVVIAAHARRLQGMARGEEPRMYVYDSGGPRG